MVSNKQTISLLLETEKWLRYVTIIYFVLDSNKIQILLKYVHLSLMLVTCVMTKFRVGGTVADLEIEPSGRTGW
jgi:hypothetical protein